MTNEEKNNLFKMTFLCNVTIGESKWLASDASPPPVKFFGGKPAKIIGLSLHL